MHTIIVYRTEKQVGWANNPHREKLDYVTKRSILRCVLLSVQDETIAGLMELSLTNKQGLAEVLSDTLDKQKGVMYSN